MTKPVSVTVSSGVAVSAKSTSKTPEDHVAVFNLAADGGANNAGLNVVSANTAFSACEVSGHETGHGTLKISHVNPGPNPASDANAAAISIDLQAGLSRHLPKVNHRRHLRGDHALRRFHRSDDLRSAARRIAAAPPACHPAAGHQCRAETVQRRRDPWGRGLHRHIHTLDLRMPTSVLTADVFWGVGVTETGSGATDIAAYRPVSQTPAGDSVARSEVARSLVCRPVQTAPQVKPGYSEAMGSATSSDAGASSEW